MKEIDLENAFVGGSKQAPNLSWLSGGAKPKAKPKAETKTKPKAKVTKTKAKVIDKKKGGQSNQAYNQAVNRMNADRIKNDRITDAINTAMAVPLAYKLGKSAKNLYTKYVTNRDDYEGPEFDQDVTSAKLRGTSAFEEPQFEAEYVPVTDTRVLAPVSRSLIPKPSVSNTAGDVGDDAGDVGDDIGDVLEDIGEIGLGKKPKGKKGTVKPKGKTAKPKPKAKPKAVKPKAKPKTVKPKAKPKAKPKTVKPKSKN